MSFRNKRRSTELALKSRVPISWVSLDKLHNLLGLGVPVYIMRVITLQVCGVAGRVSLRTVMGRIMLQSMSDHIYDSDPRRLLGSSVMSQSDALQLPTVFRTVA